MSSPSSSTSSHVAVPSSWNRSGIPLFFSEIRLPPAPTITSPALAEEFSALKDTLHAQAGRLGPAKPSSYELDCRSNKVLELTGDALLRWIVMKIARQRYPNLTAQGIQVRPLLHTPPARCFRRSSPPRQTITRPLLENNTFAYLSWHYDAFVPTHQIHSIPQHAPHRLQNQGMMANLFEAYAGALGMNGQTQELEEWILALWVSGVYGDIDRRVRDWIDAHQSKLHKPAVGARERKRRRKGNE